MPTYTRCEGFEHGSALADTTYDGILSSIGSAGGTPANSTTYARTGTRSFRVNKSSAGASWGKILVSADQIVGEVWIYPETIPSVDSSFLAGESTTGAVSCRLMIRASDGMVGVKIGADAAVYGTVPVVADQWQRISFKIFCQATTYTVDYSVGGKAQTQVTSGSRTATTVASLYIGSATAADVFDIYYDDLTLSHTSADHPLPSAKVYSIIPTADGSHSLGGVISDAGGGTTNLFQSLDAIAGDTAVFVRQTANGLSNYAEVVMGDRTDRGGPILCARAFVAHTASTSGANQAETRASDDNFSATDTVWNGATGVATTPIRWKSAMLSNALDINNIKVRVGFGGTTTPNPRWSLVMVQYAVADGIPPLIMARSRR